MIIAEIYNRNTMSNEDFELLETKILLSHEEYTRQNNKYEVIERYLQGDFILEYIHQNKHNLLFKTIFNKSDRIKTIVIGRD